MWKLILASEPGICTESSLSGRAGNHDSPDGMTPLAPRLDAARPTGTTEVGFRALGSRSAQESGQGDVVRWQPGSRSAGTVTPIDRPNLNQ